MGKKIIIRFTLSPESVLMDFIRKIGKVYGKGVYIVHILFYDIVPDVKQAGQFTVPDKNRCFSIPPHHIEHAVILGVPYNLQRPEYAALHKVLALNIDYDLIFVAPSH